MVISPKISKNEISENKFQARKPWEKPQKKKKGGKAKPGASGGAQQKKKQAPPVKKAPPAKEQPSQATPETVGGKILKMVENFCYNFFYLFLRL